MPYKRKTTGYCVYKLTAPNGKVYIGTTSRDPRARWNSGYGYLGNKPLDNAIRLYGWHTFTKEVLFDGLSKEEAHAKETEKIAEYDSANKRRGYNHTLSGQAGGVFGHTLTEDGRRKCSEANKGLHVGSKSPRARKVNQYSLDGKFVKTWGATTEVQRELGIHYTNVVKCCTGVYKTVGGFVWQYA